MRMRPRDRTATWLLVSATVVLGGCDAWDRLVERLARLIAIAFLVTLAPVALGGAAGLYVTLRRAPTGAALVVAWALAISAGFLVGILDQFIPALRRHAAWVAFLPALALPAGAWAIVGSARLARARGLPPWVVAGLGVVGAAYVAWLAVITAHGLG